jgi:3-oxosteroid 1-dehydrogenase
MIATGGFERDEQMRQRYQRAPIGTEWSTGAPGNTGDGIRAGQDLGAATGPMDDAWWGPSIPLRGGPYFCLAERSLPGCLLVNGRRRDHRPGHDVRLYRGARHGGRTGPW